MTFNFDVAIVSAILACFGIGLKYIINFLKGLLRVQDKPAVLLVLAVSALGTAITLLIAGGFTLPAFLIYTVAVFGEATGFFRLTKPTA